jgi:hypothetical protein
MKSAQLEQSGEPIKEVVVILNPSEADILHQALMDFAARHKKSKKIKALLEQFADCPIFF